MIEGRYFAPMSAKASPARMEAEGKVASIWIEQEAEPLKAQITLVGAKLGTIPRRIEFASGAVFEAHWDAEFEFDTGREAGMLARVFKLENSWRTVAIVSVATIFLVYGFVRFGLPALASAAASATPNTVIALIDAGSLDTVDRTLFDKTEMPLERQAELQAYFKELTANANTGGIPLELVFRSSPRLGPNAFALPGGTIIMTDELVDAAKNDDEIIGVLAHEIGHVEERHSTQMIYRAAGLAVLVGAVAGDSGQLVDQVVTQVSALQQLSYSREFEDRADNRSVELMVKAGRDPIAFVKLIDRISSEIEGEASESTDRDSKTNWLSTHPGNADRLTAVTARAKVLGWKP